jgi:bacterioferritin
MANQFEIDVSSIRDDARAKMAQGPVTEGYQADRQRVIEVLNDVVATEVVCFLRYSQHAIAATGIDRTQVAAEFREHARQEMDHGLRAAERVSQLGGKPDFDPTTLAARSHTGYVETAADDLRRMLQENPGRRTDRDHQLPGDHPVARRQRPDNATTHGVHPGRVRGTTPTT